MAATISYKEIVREALTHGVEIHQYPDRIMFAGPFGAASIWKVAKGNAGWTVTVGNSDGTLLTVKGTKGQTADTALSYVVDGPL